jgi:hypothetical protein
VLPRFPYSLSLSLLTGSLLLLALQARARLLYDAGYKSPADIAKARPEDLVRAVGKLSRKAAREIIVSAQVSYSPFPKKFSFCSCFIRLFGILLVSAVFYENAFC